MRATTMAIRRLPMPLMDDRTGQEMLKGRCMRCGFLGVCIEKDVLLGQDVQTLMVCVTCSETPAGRQSENQEHMRLPDEEYRRHASRE